MRQLAAQGVAIVYISHRIDEVMLLADTVTVLRDGRHVTTRPIVALSQDQIIAAMVGRNSLGMKPISRNATNVPILSVRHLSLEVAARQGWRRVLDGVGFDVCRGEILGIGGLLGSGRTEILETIFGSASGRRGGNITIEAQAVAIRSP